ncbi:MAG: carbohydrate ABC transporter permease, partial [Actinobacteria bacterium]|nr:carbohydrate ABC transporter permease [Actinomycetota bacterium]
ILIIGCLTAFGLSRFKFKGRRLFINSIILIRMIPILVFAIPYFVMFKTIRLTDSLIGLVIVYIAGNLPLAIWLLLGFFNKVDPAIYESAMIDGCSNFGLFRYIGIHLIKPGIITIAILVFMFSWNEFFMALVLIFSDSNKTLPIAISSMIQLHKEIPVGTIAAAGMIIMIPTILFSLFLQKYIVRGLMSSTVKG